MTRPVFHCILEPEAGPDGTVVTFDEAYARLVELPRMFLEPDGSFVWVSPRDEEGWRWKLDGMLQDGGPRLAFLELKGHCGPEVFAVILAALGAPPASVRIQLPRQGVYLRREDFINDYLAAGAGITGGRPIE